MRPHMYPQPEEPDHYLHPYQPSAREKAPSPAPAADGPDVRARLVRRFEAWLDEVLIEEQAPEGVAQEILARLQATEDTSTDTSDLYGLFSALTALTQEARLQGGAFKQLQEAMAQLQHGVAQLRAECGKLQDGLNPLQPLAASVEALAGQDAQAHAEKVAQARQAAQQESHKAALAVLIDVRDRLVLAKDMVHVKAERPGTSERGGLLAKLLPSSKGPVQAAPAPGLAQELEKGVNRIDETLQQWNVRAMACVGQSFDGQTMQAVERVAVPEKPDNTVLEVCREGYWWNDEVYRVAQVKVATNPANQ